MHRARLRARFSARPVAARLALLLVLSAAAAPGCQKSLIREDDPRTQYDRYDAQRNQLSDQWIVDEFGQRRPNLRGRLSPKPD